MRAPYDGHVLFDVTPECRAAAEGSLVLRGRVQLFAHRLVDRLLTRTPPWVPFAVYAPAIASLFATHTQAGVLASGAAFACGVLMWTFAEYLLHRFGLHLPQQTRGMRLAYFLVHGHHHAYARDRSRLVATLPQSASFLALLYGLASAFTRAAPIDAEVRDAVCAMGLAGAMAGYLVYEAIHFAIHHGRVRSPIARALARHHLAHHRDSTSRFGISSPLWDVVFRTLPPREDSRTARRA